MILTSAKSFLLQINEKKCARQKYISSCLCCCLLVSFMSGRSSFNEGCWQKELIKKCANRRFNKLCYSKNWLGTILLYRISKDPHTYPRAKTSSRICQHLALTSFEADIMITTQRATVALSASRVRWWLLPKRHCAPTTHTIICRSCKLFRIFPRCSDPHTISKIRFICACRGELIRLNSNDKSRCLSFVQSTRFLPHRRF